MTRALLFCVLICGCKQDAGERCQTNSDCSGSLICCPICIDPQTLEGTCRAECSCPVQDGGGDGGQIDASTDGRVDAPAAPASPPRPAGSESPAPVNAASLRNFLLSTGHLTFPRASDAKMPPKQRTPNMMNAVFTLVRKAG